VVVVVITTIQVPVRPNLYPFRTRPTPQDAQAVLVATNAAVSAPEPARALVVTVTSPQMPVRAHATPVALVIAVKCTQPVLMVANASEASPSPPGAPVETMVIVVLAP